MCWEQEAFHIFLVVTAWNFYFFLPHISCQLNHQLCLWRKSTNYKTSSRKWECTCEPWNIIENGQSFNVDAAQILRSKKNNQEETIVIAAYINIWSENILIFKLSWSIPGSIFDIYFSLLTSINRWNQWQKKCKIKFVCIGLNNQNLL